MSYRRYPSLSPLPPLLTACADKTAPPPLAADIYGDSEEILGKWFAANPSKRADIFVATKFGMKYKDGKSEGIDSSPAYCRGAIERSLSRMGVPFVDLFYAHRLDTVTPVEQTMRCLVELKDEGKIKHIGLSEPSAASLRRAYAVHPVTAVQIEYSPFFPLEVEQAGVELLQACRELGVAVVTSSPLARGLFGGAIKGKDDLSAKGDLRHSFGLPWFQDANLEHNLKLVRSIAELAKTKGADVTPAQMTLAWILAQGDDFFPIPGTTKLERLRENLAAADIDVTPEEEKSIRQLADEVKGLRLQKEYQKFNFADTPDDKA